jgi:hypothetical protein
MLANELCQDFSRFWFGYRINGVTHPLQPLPLRLVNFADFR